MKPVTSFLLAILVVTAAVSLGARSSPPDPRQSNGKSSSRSDKGGGNDGGLGGFFGPGTGVGIPGFDKGWGDGVAGGYGAGFGGPTGGFARGGVTKDTVVCKEKGPCFNKKLTCPAKCFTSFSQAGKGYGSGGGGGGCTMDCKKKCTAYC